MEERAFSQSSEKSEDGETTPLSFDTQFGSNANVFEDVSPTLKASQQSPSVMFNEKQDPTIVFQPGTMIRFGGGVWDELVPTLRAEVKRGDNEPHVIQYDGYNQKVNTDDVSVTLRIGRDSSDFVAQQGSPTLAIRRLTPLECERLMGWEDGWTKHKADLTEQADTHRYKQCGNGVASPVATWIGKHLMKLSGEGNTNVG